jgi:hypothetical protein
MIKYGVLIMLVAECLEDVGCGCEETSPYVACSTRSYKVDNWSCERLQKWTCNKSCERIQKLRGCKIGGSLQSFLALIYWLPYVE